MSTPFNRHSPRLATYDYSSPGAYFVTLCTVERQAFFNHAELQTILEDTWKALPQRFPAVKLDEFVIMPNHVHFILWVKEEVEDRPVLGKMIGAYKSLCAVAWTHHTGTPGSGQFWQKNYYEHIIRGELGLHEKREYIRNNPVKDELKREGRGK